MDERLKERLVNALRRSEAQRIGCDFEDLSPEESTQDIDAILAELTAAGYAVVRKEAGSQRIAAMKEKANEFNPGRPLPGSEARAIWNAALAAKEQDKGNDHGR